MSGFGTVLGIGLNELAPNVPRALLESAARLGVNTREIDLASMCVDLESQVVSDCHGIVAVSHLSPALFYWADAALDAYTLLEQLGAKTLNTIASVELADDKARTALRLRQAAVPQLRTIIVEQSTNQVRLACDLMGYPCVLKRTHGGQGRWVRKIENPDDLPSAIQEFSDEGPSAVVVQEIASDFIGRSIRVLVLGGEVVASALRIGAPGSFVSNISSGGSQEIIELTETEKSISIAAAKSLGLGFAGVDVTRHRDLPFVLEVNACPDFTSMIPLLGDSFVDDLITLTVS